MLVQPLLFLILISSSFWLFQEAPNLTLVIVIRVVTVGMAFLLGSELLNRALVKIQSKPNIEYDIGNWLPSTLPFLLINATYIVYNKTDALMLGVMRGTTDVGIYFVLNRISELILFVVIAVNTSLKPTIASLYVQKKQTQLQELINKGSRITVILAFPLALCLIIFGKYILLIFGPEFVGGYSAFIVSCLGKLFLAVTGLTAVILTMTGYENYIAIAIGSSSILNFVLNYLLIPKWGVMGASIATSGSILCCNACLTRTQLNIK